jgi:serine kinase of HPr protein (carbohydrate metabolism regulator)
VTDAAVIRHAGLIATRAAGRWAGVLIEGPSGAGKSDLALRALDQGFRLVADDRTIVWASGGRLWGRAPETLHGLIEMRGLPIGGVLALPLAEIALVVRCGKPERLPEMEAAQILGVAIPAVTLAPLEVSAPAKLSRALALFDHAKEKRM